MYGKLKFA